MVPDLLLLHYSGKFLFPSNANELPGHVARSTQIQKHGLVTLE
jgi:hypothetical protein